MPRTGSRPSSINTTDAPDIDVDTTPAKRTPPPKPPRPAKPPAPPAKKIPPAKPPRPAKAQGGAATEATTGATGPVQLVAGPGGGPTAVTLAAVAPPGGFWSMGQAIGDGGTPTIVYVRSGFAGTVGSAAFKAKFSFREKDAARYAAFKAAAGGDPHFRFDDGKRTVETSYTYQQLIEQNKAFRGLLDGAATAHLGQMGASAEQDAIDFAGTEDYAAWRAFESAMIRANADARLKDFSYDAYDAKFTDGERQALDQRLTGATGTEGAKHLLQDKDYPGFILSEEHTDANSKKFLVDNMAELKASGVNTLYIEHVRFTDHQKMVGDFMSSSDAEVQGPLRTFLDASDEKYGLKNKHPDNLRGVIEAAKANGLRVVGIDSALAKDPRGAAVDLPLRAKLMNTYAESVIRNDTPARNGGKYVVLVGEAHSHTHAGQPHGHPGLSQLLEIPAIRTDGDKLSLHEEDKSLR